MPFSKNDFILVDYTLTIKESGEVIETTNADEAKKYNIFKPDEVYEPLLVIIGEGRVVEGFEEALSKSDVGKEEVIEVPPEKAYGPRDPNKVRVIPLREFVRAGITPEVGKVVEIGGNLGIVRSVSGGRVIVDFNHPLAGKTLVYKFKIIKKIDDFIEKIKHLLHRRLKKISVDKFSVEFSKGEGRVTIELPREAYFMENIQVIKRIVAEELFRLFEDVKSVVYVEKYVRSS